MVSKSRKLVLIFLSEREKIYNCGNRLVISEQGSAIHVHSISPNRFKRCENNVGLIQTPQLATQITRVSYDVVNDLNFS